MHKFLKITTELEHFSLEFSSLMRFMRETLKLNLKILIKLWIE